MENDSQDLLNLTEVECRCGNVVVCWRDQFTNTCTICGRDYDYNGKLLADRSQWGEETGETLSDILVGGSYGN